VAYHGQTFWNRSPKELTVSQRKKKRSTEDKAEDTQGGTSPRNPILNFEETIRGDWAMSFFLVLTRQEASHPPIRGGKWGPNSDYSFRSKKIGERQHKETIIKNKVEKLGWETVTGHKGRAKTASGRRGRRVFLPHEKMTRTVPQVYTST